MTSFRLLPILGLVAVAASACAPTLGPSAPGRGGPPRSAEFNAADFAWAKAPGANGIAGRGSVRQGGQTYTCAGAGVVLTPETPWSRRRMSVLYGSTERAALPADEVRQRTPSAPPGDPGPHVKRATCDAQDRFSFSKLPNGAWYVITIARPVGQPSGTTIALMKRVTTRGGRVTQVTF